jgi:XisI protein
VGEGHPVIVSCWQMVNDLFQHAVHAVFDKLKARQVLLPPGIERQLVLDDHNGHYQLLNIGWQGNRHTHAILVRIDIKGNLIWVQADNTEYGIVDELLNQGVLAEQIVLGFQAPYKRKYSGFAQGD